MVTEPHTVDGWPDGLRLALDNLLDNAALHGRPAGSVEVAVTADGVIVDDDGAGIAVRDRQNLTRRFTRGDAPRAPGSGLGLALVDQQARLHGGTLVLGDSPLGGLRVTFAVGGTP